MIGWRQVVPAALVAAVVAVAAFLRFEGLGEPSYWLDEILGQVFAERAATLPFWRWLTGVHAQHGPIYYALQLLGNAVAPNEWGGRLFAAIFGLATVPMLWLASRQATNDLGAAAVSALLLAVSPLHVYYSREGRPYALLVLLTVTLLLAILRGWRITAGVIAVAMLYTTVGSATALASAGVAAAFAAQFERDARLRTDRRVIAVILLIVAAVVPLLYRQAASDPTPAPFAGFGLSLVEQLVRGLSVTALNLPGGKVVAYGLLVFVAIGALALTRRNAPAAAVMITMALLPIVISVVALRLTDHFFAMRYVIAALPAYLVLAGAGVATLVRPLGRWSGAAAMVIAIVIASQTWTAARTEAFRKLDWREIARTIWTHARPGELIIAAEPWSEVSLRHYLDELPPRVGLVHIFAPDVADVQRQVRRGVWLVTAGFSTNHSTRNWMCNYPLLLASPLESFRLHYASRAVDRNDTLFFTEGWADAEGTFRWAAAKRATVTIPRWSTHDQVITMRVLPMAHASLAPQTMRVSLNGNFLGHLTLPNGWSDQSFAAPARVWIKGPNVLTFEFNHAVAPASFEPSSTDQRTLAVRFESLNVGGPLVRITALLDKAEEETRFPPERLRRDAVMPLIARLGFDPNVVWPRLASGEVRLDDVAETAAWDADCGGDLRKVFAALLEREPAPHELRELGALPRDRAIGRMLKWDEFRVGVQRP